MANVRSLTAPSRPSASVGPPRRSCRRVPRRASAAWRSSLPARRRRRLIPRGTTSTPIPPARPPPPTGTTIACDVGELGQDLAGQQAAVTGDDVVVVEGRDEHQSRILGGAAAGGRLGLVVGGADDFDLRSQRGDAGALDLGRLRRDQHRRLDVVGPGRQRDAEAMIPGGGGDHPLLCSPGPGPSRRSGPRPPAA